MQRIHVIGVSGAGKTRFARALAERLGLAHHELDAIFHQPDWTPLDEDRFRASVLELTARESWVIDGNYSAVRDLIQQRADTVLFLDLPRWRVMLQLIPRTLARICLRRELWNGNRERLQNLFSLVPEENILLWSWTTHEKHRTRFEQARADASLVHLSFVRLRSHAEAERLLSSSGIPNR